MVAASCQSVHRSATQMPDRAPARHRRASSTNLIVRILSLILALCAIAMSPSALTADPVAATPPEERTQRQVATAQSESPGDAQRPVPTAINPGRPTLPPLQAVTPEPTPALPPTGARPEPPRPAPSAQVTDPLPPPAPRAPSMESTPRVELAPRALEIADAWDERLHADLPWAYCGPRSGAAGLGGAPLPGLLADTPVHIIADRVDYDRAAETIELTGAVEVTQEGQRLEAQRSTYDRRSGDIHAESEVFLDARGLRIQGDRADYNLIERTGRIDSARYRLSGDANLLGTAETAEILAEGKSRYRNITYTTCPPGNADWSIRARDLKLDQVSGMGSARHARIRIGKVPILYTPYLSFPIDDRRRTGFLIPSFGSSSNTGTDITIPFYWNIAPNMDATISPRIMSTRGLMLGTQFRHLSRVQELEINAEILPEDRRARDDGVRGALRLLQTGRLGERWSSAVDVSSVSDDRFFQDFGNRLDVTSLRNLEQRGDLTYAGDGWRVLSRLQQFQTIDDSIAAANRPYAQMPHIELDVFPKRWNDLIEYRLDAQYDFFDHGSKVHGSRMVAIPSVRLPLRRGFGHLIPQARLYSSLYELTDTTPGQAARQSYLVPSLDVDGTLIFERETDWLGATALQTLEPRLYYVLSTFENQSDAPLFDTGLLDFSFASLFRPNRFTGYDRIGDENRLTFGLTSRTIGTESGWELFRASVGQIYYFQDRRVQLLGTEEEDELQSSVATELAARLSAHWSARASAQWNPNDAEESWEKRVLQLRYASDAGRLLNLAYRFNFATQPQLRYEDTDLSFAMPVGAGVKLVGRWLYSVLNEETTEAFAGIEFGRCCWRLRLLGQHLQTGREDGNTSIMLQIELAGLGSFGNSIDRLLEEDIYGYYSD